MGNPDNKKGTPQAKNPLENLTAFKAEPSKKDPAKNIPNKDPYHPDPWEAYQVEGSSGLTTWRLQDKDPKVRSLRFFVLTL